MQLVSPNFSDLLVPNIEIGKFPDGDSHIHIPQLAECRGQEVMLFHRLYPNQNDALLELLLILQTLREQNCQVTVVAPYLPYARQDKKKLDGEIMSAGALCNLLARAGCRKLMTFDCHFLNETGESVYSDLPIKNLSMSEALIDYARNFFAGESFEVIGPDAGAAYLVKGWGGKFMRKARQGYQNGTVGYRQVETLEGEFDVRDKNVLLLDDMISTGSTMIKALEKIRSGGAKRVCCAATHGLFLHNSLDKLRNLMDAVFATDTIVSALSKVSIHPKILELSSAEPKLF